MAKRKVTKTHKIKNEYDCNGNPLPEWITSEEIVTTISDCTHVLKADVKDVLDCYYMLLYEALMKGFMVNFPEIGYFTNRYIPEKTGTYNFGSDNSGEYKVDEHNEPEFAFHPMFVKEMKNLTYNNPYSFADSPYSSNDSDDESV